MEVGYTIGKGSGAWRARSFARRAARGSREVAALALCVAGLGAAAPALGYDVRKCDEIARNEISVAADYIDKRIGAIAGELTNISAANRAELVKKWPRMAIVCRDEGQTGKSRECLSDTTNGGFAHGGPGNKVNICYYNVFDWTPAPGATQQPDTLCALVGIIIHETGHSIGVASFANHNDATQYVQDNDPVYVMGTKAADFCRADTKFITDRQLIGRSALALGDACRADDQCTSGRCLGGTCQCDQDGDCPTGQACFKPVAGKNFCARTDLALGAACTRDSECRSDHCERGACVCRHDGDCPQGQICRTPIAGANFCEAGADGALALGAACQRDAQCKSGRCEGGACVCRSDSDCATGMSCFTPITGANFCQSTTLALGAACNRDSQCRSDKCQGGACTCKADSDCKDGQKCKKPLIGANHCG